MGGCVNKFPEKFTTFFLYLMYQNDIVFIYVCFANYSLNVFGTPCYFQKLLFDFDFKIT